MQLYDRDTNLRIGFRYLRTLVREYKGNVQLALLVYNRGPQAVRELARPGARSVERLRARGHEGIHGPRRDRLSRRSLGQRTTRRASGSIPRPFASSGDHVRVPSDPASVADGVYCFATLFDAVLAGAASTRWLSVAALRDVELGLRTRWTWPLVRASRRRGRAAPAPDESPAS